jgi:predicted phosphohydrolase
MDVFGPGWEGHPQAFFDGWRRVVHDDDLVLVPGDVSWALRLDDAVHDLEDMAQLPGDKVLLRGNHDYWWSSIGKVRRRLPARMHALQNDAFKWRNVVVAGTRGWVCPGARDVTEDDHKIYLRELERLDLSLRAADALREPGDRSVVMLHFPPTNARLERSGFVERIEAFAPDALVFGHVHGGHVVPVPTLKGIDVRFVAADALGFQPARLHVLD